MRYFFVSFTKGGSSGDIVFQCEHYPSRNRLVKEIDRSNSTHYPSSGSMKYEGIAIYNIQEMTEEDYSRWIGDEDDKPIIDKDDIMSRPRYFKFINKEAKFTEITLGRVYRATSGNRFYITIITDSGKEVGYFRKHFIEVDPNDKKI